MEIVHVIIDFEIYQMSLYCSCVVSWSSGEKVVVPTQVGTIA